MSYSISTLFCDLPPDRSGISPRKRREKAAYRSRPVNRCRPIAAQPDNRPRDWPTRKCPTARNLGNFREEELGVWGLAQPPDRTPSLTDCHNPDPWMIRTLTMMRDQWLSMDMSMMSVYMMKIKIHCTDCIICGLFTYLACLGIMSASQHRVFVGDKYPNKLIT